MSPFALYRDQTVYAIYAIAAPLPVTVEWPSGPQRLRIARFPYPPHLTLEFDGGGRESGCVYELESVAHGVALVRHGLKVEVPSLPRGRGSVRGALARFCDRLVRDGRATLIAGPHCDIPWTGAIECQLDADHPDTCLDAFWTWRRYAGVGPASTAGIPAMAQNGR